MALRLQNQKLPGETSDYELKFKKTCWKMSFSSAHTSADFWNRSGELTKNYWDSPKETSNVINWILETCQSTSACVNERIF